MVLGFFESRPACLDCFGCSMVPLAWGALLRGALRCALCVLCTRVWARGTFSRLGDVVERGAERGRFRSSNSVLDDLCVSLLLCRLRGLPPRKSCFLQLLLPCCSFFALSLASCCQAFGCMPGFKTCKGLRCGGGMGRGVDLLALPTCCAPNAGGVALEVVAGRGSPFLPQL